MRNWIATRLENFRFRLSRAEALPQLAALGLLTGIVAGLVIVAFRLLIEHSQTAILGSNNEAYEKLAIGWRFLLPVLGGLTLGLLFQLLQRSHNIQVGIVHVMERLQYYQGNLPFRTMLIQFLGAAVSIISGHSVGREGPSVHLGAASSSLMSRAMKLPHHSTRLLIGCGTAAAVAASFNTPLAGVIFAMEVVMMEYTLASFTPVILASVSATTIARLFFGAEIAFVEIDITRGALAELPFIVFAGVVIGAVAALFIKLLQVFSRLGTNRPIFPRLLAAGVMTGLIAIYVPDIMGIGYDTVNNSLTNSITTIGVQGLLILFAAKLLATTFGLGMGLPAGLIGPTLFIGAIAGTLLGLLGKFWYAGASESGYYALLGMGAMMGATLQAPLAALTAMLELTGNPAIILPGMLIIVTASLTSSQLFGKKSVFLMLMQARGLDYRNDPISQSLLRTGVAQAMDRDFASLDAVTTLAKVHLVLDRKPRWIILVEDKQPAALMPVTDLARHYLEITGEQEPDLAGEAGSRPVNLHEIPAKRLQLTSTALQASLQDALDRLKETGAEALYIQRSLDDGIPYIYGILTPDMIEACYNPAK